MRKVFIITILLFVGPVLSNQLQAQVLEADSLALVALYNSTGGATEWTNNSGWLTDNVNNWFGVTVAGGRVNTLSLANNNLTGNLPAELGDLGNLINLFLSNNRISGALPTSMNRLVNLRFLLLDNNQLSGFIPEALGAMQSLQDLRLSENQFKGPLPDTLATILSLRILNLQNNIELLGVIPGQIINIPLTEFRFFNTNICEPDDPGYNAWKTMVTSYSASNISCGNRQADSLALVHFYNQMGGTNWTDNTNWLSGPLETWKGIEMNLDRVSRINLSGNNLTGILPDTLGGLRYLQALEMSNNNISGAIPLPVLELSFLETLFLQANQLAGELPLHLFNQISLRQLALGQNNWTGTIPPEIINLQNLEYLVLNHTSLTGPIPEELGFLRKMRTLLSLDNNQLTGTIPATLGNMAELEILRLQNNDLTGAVPQFTDTFNFLREFDISDNRLTDLNDQNALIALTDFRVSGNFFEFDDLVLNLSLFADSTYYSPQKSFGTAQNVFVERGEGIVLSQGQVGGAQVTYQWFRDGSPVAGATNPDFAIASMDNSLSGTYVLEAYSLLALPGFKLVSEPITLTTSIPSPDEAALIALYNATDGPNWFNNTNWLTAAPIDQWYGIDAVNNRATRVFMPGNNLNGSLPPEIGNLTELTMLHLGDGNLQGGIPPEIGQLQKLDTLVLSVNPFTGTIPEEIYTLSNLRRLSISNTQLIGGISPSIANLTNLKMTALWNNNFTEDIPDEFWTMHWLEEIYLGDSDEGGAIPPEIGDFSSLRVLNIFNCQLSGTIPKEIGRATNLRRLQIPDNQLTGPLPNEINNLTFLNTLDIKGNSFDQLPALQGLDSLAYLDISDNKFTFSDILPNQQLITINSGQKPFGETREEQAYKFEPLILDYPNLEEIAGQQYQWYKDGQPIPSGIDYSYTIDNVGEEDAGIYFQEINHSDVDGLFLTGNAITVNVREGDPPKPEAVKIVSIDGANPEFVINNIEYYEKARVLIYDVLGRLVYKSENYRDETFVGNGNVNGFGQLPSGTYYYLIDVGDTRKNGTGFFVMKRR